MMEQNQIKQLHNGLIKCPISEVENLMPEILPILKTAPVSHGYVVDCKVHMLMPNQYPCIPNWHGDAIPRDENNRLVLEKCNDDLGLYLWLSGPPITEFKDGRKVEVQKWVKFKQRDIHRGTISDKHQWRLFIRLMPESLVVRPRTGSDCLRRHSQVYLDAEQFTW